MISAHTSAIINVLSSAVRKASRRIIRDFGEIENLQVTKKNLGGFVSVADRRSEEVLIEELGKARPSYSILSEEAGSIKKSDPSYTWIIDPLDGTTNFLHGIPHFSISVALQKDDAIIAGVTYDPIKDELYWAERGVGAYVNRRRLRVSSRIKPDEALLGFGRLAIPNIEIPKEKLLKNLMSLGMGLRRSGSVSLDLAYVASGRLDVFFQGSTSLWDVAAGTLLIKEAGGRVTDYLGNSDIFKIDSIVATNQKFHPLVLGALELK